MDFIIFKATLSNVSETAVSYNICFINRISIAEQILDNFYVMS